MSHSRTSKKSQNAPNNLSRSRSKILGSYMRRRKNDTDTKFLTELSPAVRKHLAELMFNTLSSKLMDDKANLLSGEYPAIFVAKGHTVSLDKWESHIDDAMLKANDGLAEFIESTLDLYNTKNNKYGYNDLPYRLFRVSELYESTDTDVTQRLEKYKAGVKKYLNLMKTDANVRKDLDTEFWGLTKIKEKIDNPDLECNTKFNKIGVCPIDFYYGPYDIPKDIKDADLSNFHMESVIDYLLDDTVDYSCYKHTHLRQCVMGNMNTIRPFYNNKYFQTEPSTSRLHSKYPEITWDTTMNDIHIKCLIEHTFNQINMPLFPLRIYIDDRYVSMLDNPNVSRYDYVTQTQLEQMTYLGCFLIPTYSYYFKKNGVIHYIEPSTRINGSTNIEDEFRKDITTNSKTMYNETDYIKAINDMLNSLMQGDPDSIINIELNNTDDGKKDKFNVKRNKIQRAVMVYNFHLFKQDNSYTMINYRANILQPGFILERFKFLYKEMIQIYYLLRNLYKMPFFRLHRYMDTNMFFFSPYYDNGKADNPFNKKKRDLFFALTKKGGDIHIHDNNIHITAETLADFYDKLKPYDVYINHMHGRALYLKPITGRASSSVFTAQKLGGGIIKYKLVRNNTHKIKSVLAKRNIKSHKRR